MSDLEEKYTTLICPYCKVNFKKQIEMQKKEGLFTILIKNHPDSNNCSPFIAFIDKDGRHRGSQKIDTVEKEDEINDELLQNARNTINELENVIRFYHIKIPRTMGRSFEHKVANVKDKAFMSSRTYMCLIDYLIENESSNTFGIITINIDQNFEGGLLIFGKYLGMLFTLFWKDQKELLTKSIEDLKAYANLTIEKLLDLYNLTDLFY